LLHHALHEDGRLARAIDRSPHSNVGDRAVIVVLDVVFAAPHDFDRFADGLRGFHRISHEVRFSAPAEAAAEIRRVNVHRILR
jgi:hypothetical protein